MRQDSSNDFSLICLNFQRFAGQFQNQLDAADFLAVGKALLGFINAANLSVALLNFMKSAEAEDTKNTTITTLYNNLQTINKFFFLATTNLDSESYGYDSQNFISAKATFFLFLHSVECIKYQKEQAEVLSTNTSSLFATSSNSPQEPLLSQAKDTSESFCGKCCSMM